MAKWAICVTPQAPAPPSHRKPAAGAAVPFAVVGSLLAEARVSIRDDFPESLPASAHETPGPGPKVALMARLGGAEWRPTEHWADPAVVPEALD